MSIIYINPYHFAAAAGPTDPDFANVSLLLHGDGANGSTTIIDSSSAARSATIIGDTQISTAQSKFGGSSIAFDGTGDALTFPDSDDFYLPSDFTIETFLYANSWPSTVYLFGQYQTADFAPVVGYFANGNPGILASSNNSSAFLLVTSSGTPLATGAWHHVAWVRSGNRWSIYVNGTERLIAASNSGTPYNSTGAFRIGNLITTNNFPFNGYIDEFRITRGVARYQANFTPPTAPFPDA